MEHYIILYVFEVKGVNKFKINKIYYLFVTKND